MFWILLWIWVSYYSASWYCLQIFFSNGYGLIYSCEAIYLESGIQMLLNSLTFKPFELIVHIWVISSIGIYITKSIHFRLEAYSLITSEHSPRWESLVHLIGYMKFDWIIASQLSIQCVFKQLITRKPWVQSLHCMIIRIELRLDKERL